MFCPNCGTKNEPNAVFCSNCGQRLQTADSPATPVRQEPPSSAPVPSNRRTPTRNRPPHFHKKNIIIIALISILVLIGGGVGYYLYGQHQSAAQTNTVTSSQSAQSENSNTSSTTQQSSSSAPALWSSNKNSNLASFMSSWEETMNQSYLGTYNGQDVDDDGLTYPTDIKDGTYRGKVTVNGNDVTLKWAPNADTNAAYQVVAASVYSHDEEGEEQVIAYLYVFHNQQPEVLVSQDANSTVHNFTPTENKALQNGFAKIANE